MKMSKPIALVAALAVALVAAQANAAINDGLIAYWPLDGDLQDVSANSNDGTLESTSGTSSASFTAGKFGDGIDLDKADAQRIRIAADPSLNVEPAGGGDGNLSISAWFRVDGFDQGWQALIAKGEQTSWRIARRAETSGIGYAGGSAEGPDTILPPVDDGELHHVVAVSENGVSTRLWLDGELISTGPAPTIALPTSLNETVLLGGNPDSATDAAGAYRSWNGLMDDVALWNRVISEDEIQSIWNGGDGASIGSLVPEPSTVVLVGLSAMALLAVRRKRG